MLKVKASLEIEQGYVFHLSLKISGLCFGLMYKFSQMCENAECH